KSILASQKEGDYVVNYISELKDAATITRNYEILRVPEPTEDEMRQAYEKEKQAYKEPEKWVIEQIEIADTTARAKKEAQKAWAKLGAGEAFDAVANEFGKDSTFTNMDYVVGMRGEAFDKAVTSLNPEEFSKPIEEGGKYFIVRLKERISASYIPFDVVKDEVRRSLMEKREEKKYEENKNRTLFTLHGRRFTLGDFHQEFKELPPAEREKHRTYEERAKLVDRMIERLLLLEDSYDRMLNAKNKEQIEHIREDILKQVFHREEVDQKLEVSDEEVKRFYEENKERFKTPPRLKISIIVVHKGQGEEEDKKAREKIEEAYHKLKPGLFKKGMPFEGVARQYSEDPRTAQNGGKLDHWISEGGSLLSEILNHPFHKKFTHLKEGKVTEPFSIGNDYLIVKVRERQEPRQQSFEELKDHLKEDLMLKKHDKLTAKMYSDMIGQANLVIYDQVLESIVNKQKEVSSSQ
ncbi:MAG: peptidyl-prolyl cis-trans isomerase, partial [Thermodesulfobacteriota bacterium]